MKNRKMMISRINQRKKKRRKREIVEKEVNVEEEEEIKKLKTKKNLNKENLVMHQLKITKTLNEDSQMEARVSQELEYKQVVKQAQLTKQPFLLVVLSLINKRKKKHYPSQSVQHQQSQKNYNLNKKTLFKFQTSNQNLKRVIVTKEEMTKTTPNQ